MFSDRRDAGRRLAELLRAYGGAGTLVVGLPRGGVVVAAEVAERLDAPLDIVVVRKLGVPWQPELGIGAIAEGGVRVLNESLVREVGVSDAELESVTRRERAELDRRVAAYRGARPRLPVAGRTVIAIDDGLATGYTARAAIASLRAAGAGRVVLAAPVAPEESVADLARVADDVVVVATPGFFFAIGQFYGDFAQTSDDEVVALLAAAAGRVRGGGPGTG